MSFLWDGFKDAAAKVGSAAGKASIKAKLKADLLFIDREISSRQMAFGVEVPCRKSVVLYFALIVFLKYKSLSVETSLTLFFSISLSRLALRLRRSPRQTPRLLFVRRHVDRHAATTAHYRPARNFRPRTQTRQIAGKN